MDRVIEAAIRFLTVWRAPLGASAKSWLAASDKAEKDLVDALRACGVNVEAAIRDVRAQVKRP